MKFMVEFRLKPLSKYKVLDVFELRGPNRTPGVTFRGAWMGSKTDVAYILMEAAEASLIEQAAKFWSEHGDCAITPVVDVEQY
jgi:hypothetical protein